MSTGVKVAIAVVALVVVGATVAFAGMFYAAHKVSEKLREVASTITSTPDSTESAASSSSAAQDVCRLLSKDDVSAAIGVPIVRAENTDGGCSYYAKGDQAEMTSKHLSAMAGANGANAQQQQMAQAISGAFFKSMQDQDKGRHDDGTGTVPVLIFSVDDNAAQAQMKLSSGVLGNLGPRHDVQGIGDEAFVTGESMMMVRKGDKLVRIMYMTCPCNTDAIKPLAAKIAGAL